MPQKNTRCSSPDFILVCYISVDLYSIQEAVKDDKAHIVENGTHADDSNSLDDSRVMPLSPA